MSSPPSAPPLQFWFLHEGPRTTFLKVARSRFTAGLIVAPVGVVAEVLMLGFDADLWWHLASVVLAITGMWCLLTGPRTAVDDSARTLHTHDGERVSASQIDGFDLRLEHEVSAEGGDSWGQLYAILRDGDAVLIAQSITPDKLILYGESLAARFGVSWLPAERESRRVASKRSSRR